MKTTGAITIWVLDDSFSYDAEINQPARNEVAQMQPGTIIKGFVNNSNFWGERVVVFAE
jgi:hypothetical protein